MELAEVPLAAQRKDFSRGHWIAVSAQNLAAKTWQACCYWTIVWVAHLALCFALLLGSPFQSASDCQVSKVEVVWSRSVYSIDPFAGSGDTEL